MTKKAKAVRQTGMVVRRETRADMADAWVRKIVREEITDGLAEINQVVKQVSREIERVCVDLESLERRSGDFTGMTESETSQLVKRLVKDLISQETMQRLVFRVLNSFYGSNPDKHPSFREAISQDHVEWWRKDFGK